MDASGLLIMISTLLMTVILMRMPTNRWGLSILTLVVWATIVVVFCDDKSAVGREVAGYKHSFVDAGWHLPGKP